MERFMDDEMAKALALDGEKLRQLTGEDHGPWEMCDTCGDPVPWTCIIFTADGCETFRCDECRTNK
jgi:hypothetical protein